MLAASRRGYNEAMEQSRINQPFLQWLKDRAQNTSFAILMWGLLLVAGIWIFAELADEVMEGEARQVDIMILQALRETTDNAMLRGPAWLEEAAREVTTLGGGPVITLVTIIVVGYLLMMKDYRSVFMVLIAIVGGSLLVGGLKMAFGRPRPEVVPHLLTETSLSFPSGHSAMAAIVYMSLAALLTPIQSRRRARVYIVVVALVLTLIIGISRLLLGVHYPTDVLAGWAVGIAWGAMCYLLSVYLRVRAGKKTCCPRHLAGLCAVYLSVRAGKNPVSGEPE